MPPYLTGIEGPPPKRNVVSSSLAGGAKKRCDLCYDRSQRFVSYSSETDEIIPFQTVFPSPGGIFFPRLAENFSHTWRKNAAAHPARGWVTAFFPIVFRSGNQLTPHRHAGLAAEGAGEEGQVPVAGLHVLDGVGLQSLQLDDLVGETIAVHVGEQDRVPWR